MKKSDSLSWLLLLLIASMSISSLNAQHPLNSWVRRPVPGFTANLSGVAFGNGVFVAVGASSAVLTSSDGESWTTGNAGPYGNLAHVRFLNGKFVAVGASDKILSSADGTTWTVNTLPGADCRDVAFGNGVYVVAGSTSYVSSDGTNWSVSRGPLDSVAFGNGRFVALQTGGGTSGFPPVYSTNGVDWVVASAPTGFSWVGVGEVIFGDSVFVGEASQWEGVWATVDGASWCCGFRGQVPIPVVNGGLAHGEGYFVWAGYGAPDSWGYPFIYSSTNGTSWDLRVRPSVSPDPNAPEIGGEARAAAFGRGTFVFVGNAGYIVQSGDIGGMPRIAQQPQDRAVIVDNPATFTVQATGAQPLTYQWFYNDTAIPNATNTSYSIAHVQTTNGGGYKVIITNSFGFVTSRVAQLSVAFLDIKSYAGVHILGVPGRTYRIEASPPSPINWQTLTNIILPQSPYIWIDYDTPQVGNRLYRAAELPP